jgi:thiamine pyrophosphokinase
LHTERDRSDSRPGGTIRFDPWGAQDSRAERVAEPIGGATDPWNLHRVIPAKGVSEVVDAPRAVALVFAGGDPVDGYVAARLPTGAATVVAADSGVEHALALGCKVDVVVGDFDSADRAAVDAAVAAGAEVRRYPPAKAQSDLELALHAARERGASRLVVVDGGGGRLDHLLGNLLLLASPEFADVDVEAIVGRARITVIRREARLSGAPGDLCSLFAIGGLARGVRTAGLLYPLDGEDLLPGSTRGLSNELVELVATVSIEHGTVLAVQPDFRA